MRLTEQAILQNGATAYMNVLRDTAVMNLRKNNIAVLEQQLKQTRDRFQVGEVTRTDVAQAEASLAQARSEFYAAQAQLKTSVANYRQIIGVEPEPSRAGPLDRAFAAEIAQRGDRRSRSSNIPASSRRCIRSMRPNLP